MWPDAIGETAQKGCSHPLFNIRLHIKYITNTTCSNINDLDIALEDAAAHDGLIFMTMIDNEMAAYAVCF